MYSTSAALPVLVVFLDSLFFNIRYDLVNTKFVSVIFMRIYIYIYINSSNSNSISITLMRV